MSPMLVAQRHATACPDFEPPDFGSFAFGDGSMGALTWWCRK